jgi:hypothetical protein
MLQDGQDVEMCLADAGVNEKTIGCTYAIYKIQNLKRSCKS